MAADDPRSAKSALARFGVSARDLRFPDPSHESVVLQSAIPDPSALEQLYKRLARKPADRLAEWGEPVGEQDHHLRIAKDMTGVALAADFLASVETYGSYENTQRFHDDRDRLAEEDHRPATNDDLKTSSIAWWLEEEDPQLRRPDQVPLGLTYVDRELVPLRTRDRGKATSTRSRASRRLDLLLVTDDRTPVITEVKARSDQHPFYAVVQLLMLAAQLSTPRQRERLSVGKADGPLDLCLVLAGNADRFYEPDGGWKRRPKFKLDLAQQAERLCAELLLDSG